MSSEQKSFEDEVQRRLHERAALVLATDQDVIKLLQTDKATITEQLAAMPSDFERWHLPPLLAQIETALDGATAGAVTRVDAGLRNGWQAGEDFVDKPLAAAGSPVEMRLQLLDVTVLDQLRSFTTGPHQGHRCRGPAQDQQRARPGHPGSQDTSEFRRYSRGISPEVIFDLVNSEVELGSSSNSATY